MCTHGEKRVFRLISMLNEEGRLVLKLCMRYLLPQFSSKPFGEYLGQPLIKERIDKAYSKSVIAEDQYEILYPKFGLPDVDKLDVTLMVFLLRQLHPFMKPSNQVWTTPHASNVSIEADITRVRDSRNSLSHSVGLEEAEFEHEYKQIETVLCRLVLNVRGTSTNEIKSRLMKKKCGSFEAKPDQAEKSTSVTESLERIDKDEKTTRRSSLQKDNKKGNSMENGRERRQGTFRNACMCLPCFKNMELTTIVTNDHSSLEYRCSINSIAVLQDGTVIVTDTIHNEVQAFTSSGEPFSEFACNKPNSVCAISQNIVGVSLRKDRKIIILSVDTKANTMICKSAYDIKCTCDLIGIKYNTGFLFVLCERGEVHTLNQNTGAEQAIYQTNINFPSHFDLSPDGNNIYISKGHSIQSIGLPGHTLYEYTDINGRTLTGVTTDKNKIYVCVWESGIIIKLKKDLTVIKEIFVDNLESPMALCKHRNRLYVSKYKTDLDRGVCKQIVIVKK